jgi:hypothetical protein
VGDLGKQPNRKWREDKNPPSAWRAHQESAKQNRIRKPEWRSGCLTERHAVPVAEVERYHERRKPDDIPEMLPMNEQVYGTLKYAAIVSDDISSTIHVEQTTSRAAYAGSRSSYLRPQCAVFVRR